MNKKVILKIFVLMFSILLIFWIRQLWLSTFNQGSKSSEIKTDIDDKSQMPTGPFQWCSSERKIFKWTHSALIKKLNNYSAEQLAKKFCLVEAEVLYQTNVNVQDWIYLAESVDSEGNSVFLEWSQLNHIFRANGLPFKSTILSREIKL